MTFAHVVAPKRAIFSDLISKFFKTISLRVYWYDNLQKPAHPRARMTAISSRVRCFTILHDIIDSICVSWS